MQPGDEVLVCGEYVIPHRDGGAIITVGDDTEPYSGDDFVPLALVRALVRAARETVDDFDEVYAEEGELAEGWPVVRRPLNALLAAAPWLGGDGRE